MIKKFSGLALAALLVTTASANVAEDVAFAQAVTAVQALAVEAKKAGLTQQETVAIVAKAIETNALTGVAQLSAQRRRDFSCIGLGIAAGVLVSVGGYYAWTRVISPWWYATPETADKDKSVADADKDKSVADADKDKPAADADKDKSVVVEDKDKPAVVEDKDKPAAKKTARKTRTRKS